MMHLCGKEMASPPNKCDGVGCFHQLKTTLEDVRKSFEQWRKALKIIHAGLPKTGTTSLKAALIQCGLGTVQDNSSLHSFDLIAQNDGLVNIAGPWHYRILDRLYSGARFILTTRKDTASWLRSCEFWGAKYHRADLLQPHENGV